MKLMERIRSVVAPRSIPPEKKPGRKKEYQEDKFCPENIRNICNDVKDQSRQTIDRSRAVAGQIQTLLDKSI